MGSGASNSSKSQATAKSSSADTTSAAVHNATASAHVRQPQQGSNTAATNNINSSCPKQNDTAENVDTESCQHNTTRKTGVNRRVANNKGVSGVKQGNQTAVQPLNNSTYWDENDRFLDETPGLNHENQYATLEYNKTQLRRNTGGQRARQRVVDDSDVTYYRTDDRIDIDSLQDTPELWTMWHQSSSRMSMSMASSKGLLNAPGANNCFLNSAVQVSDVNTSYYRCHDLIKTWLRSLQIYILWICRCNLLYVIAHTASSSMASLAKLMQPPYWLIRVLC